MKIMQTSLEKDIGCEGIGLHSGCRAQMRLIPAPSNTGIVFVRTDIDAKNNTVPARIEAVNETRLGTTLSNGQGADIATVEHFLSACSGLGVDNLIVEIDGPEIPILDGSARPFCDLLKKAGICALDQARRFIRILEPIHVQKGESHASLSPNTDDNFCMDVRIEFKNTIIGISQKTLTLNPQIFYTQIAEARTFAFQQDLDHLKQAGLIKGGSTDNAILVDGMRIVNDSPLRFEDEFVRHKILDAIGDLALSGAPIIGQFKTDRPGHAINTELLRTLMETRSAWRYDELQAPIPVPA